MASKGGRPVITSMQNKWVKLAKQLKQPKKRKKLQQFILEGEHLVAEALAAQAEIQMVLYTEDKADWVAKNIASHAECVTSDIMQEITETVTPQGILAIVNELKVQPFSFEQANYKLLGIDKVQDPGNLGTMIRTADAAGYDAVFLNKGTVDIYNAKVLRSMQGSQYHIPIYQVDFTTLLPQLVQEKVQLLATSLGDQTIDYREVEVAQKMMVIMGNEGNGVSEDILKQTQNIFIPMPGQAESLNVAVATGIVLFRL